MMGPFFFEELTTTEGVEFDSAISIEAFAITSLRLFPNTETPITVAKKKKEREIRIENPRFEFNASLRDSARLTGRIRKGFNERRV